jgi:hypothetical protein
MIRVNGRGNRRYQMPFYGRLCRVIPHFAAMQSGQPTAKTLADTAQHLVPDCIYLIPGSALWDPAAEQGALNSAAFCYEGNSPRESSRVSVLEDHGNALLVLPRHGLDESQGIPQVVTEPRGNLVLILGHDDPPSHQTHGCLSLQSGKPDHRPTLAAPH